MGENARKNPRAKVLSMTVRYRSATLGEFIEHHSYDVSSGGMFIKTPSPFPPGTLLKFEVKIAEDQRVMQGVGRVVWKRDDNGSDSDDPAGMGIKFIKIDEASKAVIQRLVDERGKQTIGAYDKSPDVSPQRMFPDNAQAVEPSDEDRTVMKPANELLEDALKKTEEGSVADSTRASGDDDSDNQHEAFLSSEAETLQNTSRSRKKSRGSKKSSQSESRKKAAQKRAQSSRPGADEEGPEPDERRREDARPAGTATTVEAEEGGGGRALLTLLVALLVAAGIYFATKNSTPSAPVIKEPTPVDVTPLPKPEPEPEPAPPVPEPEPEPESETVDLDEEPPSTDAAEKVVEQEVKPVAPPRPRPRPRVVKPAAVAAPAPETAPTPEAAPASPPASKPLAPTPAPTPAPAPAPAVVPPTPAPTPAP